MRAAMERFLSFAKKDCFKGNRVKKVPTRSKRGGRGRRVRVRGLALNCLPTNSNLQIHTSWHKLGKARQGLNARFLVMNVVINQVFNTREYFRVSFHILFHNRGQQLRRDGSRGRVMAAVMMIRVVQVQRNTATTAITTLAIIIVAIVFVIAITVGGGGYRPRVCQHKRRQEKLNNIVGLTLE